MLITLQQKRQFLKNENVYIYVRGMQKTFKGKGKIKFYYINRCNK